MLFSSDSESGLRRRSSTTTSPPGDRHRREGQAQHEPVGAGKSVREDGQDNGLLLGQASASARSIESRIVFWDSSPIRCIHLEPPAPSVASLLPFLTGIGHAQPSGHPRRGLTPGGFDSLQRWAELDHPTLYPGPCPRGPGRPGSGSAPGRAALADKDPGRDRGLRKSPAGPSPACAARPGRTGRSWSS